MWPMPCLSPTIQRIRSYKIKMSSLTSLNSLFGEHLFDAARKATTKDSFWLELKDEYLDETIFETLDFADHKVLLTFDKIESLGELISLIVDAKSPFTHFHSLRVADLAYTLSGYMRFGERDRRTLRIAGLLHDVEKLRTPDEILEKPDSLSLDEFTQMRSHPLDSKRVLMAIFPHTTIAKWASEHHEKLDGSGDQIDTPTRILTIADIFQALCHERPYRERLCANEVLSIMDRMADKGQIDLKIHNLLKVNVDELYKTAIREG